MIFCQQLNMKLNKSSDKNCVPFSLSIAFQETKTHSIFLFNLDVFCVLLFSKIFKYNCSINIFHVYTRI